MTQSIKKLFMFLTLTGLISGCANPISSSQNSSIDSSVDTSSSSESSTSKEESQNSSVSESSSSSSSFSITSIDTNPNNCDNHQLVETIIKEPTLLEKGIVNYQCPNCEMNTNGDCYKMDEFVFEDMTYMYDGNEHKVFIDGVLPYGVKVQYENNARKELGEQEATAKFYDDKNVFILEKKAKINIIENIGLPNVRITTEDGEDPDHHSVNGERPYKNMNLTIDNSPIAEQNFSDKPGEIKVRGNSTNQESVAKRAFRLKLSKKANLLGLNDGLEEKSWVLLADFFDQSRFRNETAFTMGNSLFNYSGFYSSDYKHVNLYMNGENRGVYLLAEQQQAKKGRIPINEADKDYTGTDVGYLIEIDGLVTQQGHVDSQTHIGTLEGDPCFTTGTGSTGGWGGQGGTSINGVSIQDKGYAVKTDCYGDEQVPFIRDYINNVLKAYKGLLKGESNQIVDENGELKDSPYTTQYETLNAYLDIDSFMRMYVLQEFLKDYDVGWGSFYMYVDFSKKSTVKRLTMSAPWDFDLGVGSKQASGSGGWGGWGGQGGSSNDKEIPSSGISSTKDNFLNNKEYATGMTTSNPWLYMLSQTDFFQSMFKKYYSIFANSSIFEKMISNIEYERVAFKDVFDDNHTRYGKGSSGATLMQTRQYDNFTDATTYLLRWLNERKTYLDNTYLLK